MRISTKLVVFSACFLSFQYVSTSLSLGGELVAPTRTLLDAVKPPGKLVISSEPPGLDVYLNCNNIGKTPVWVSRLAPGSHNVRIKDSEIDIYVQPHGTLQVSIFKGSFIILKKEKVEGRPCLEAEHLTEVSETVTKFPEEHKQQGLTLWERFINRSSPHF